MEFSELPQPERKERVNPDELDVDGDNPNAMSGATLDLLKQKIRDRGWIGNHIIADTDGLIADGEHRWRAARDLGLDEVPVKFYDLTDEERRLIRQELNKIRGEHDAGDDADEYERLLENGYDEELGDLLDATSDTGELSEVLQEAKDSEQERTEEIVKEVEPEYNLENPTTNSLADDFGAPPISVLDANQPYWRDRKQEWRETTGLGDIDEAREEIQTTSSERMNRSGTGSTTSIFDPVLAELMYRWFAPSNATVLDPYAGGLVRGALASWFGHEYHGVDINEEQIEVNRRRWDEEVTPPETAPDSVTPPTYHHGGAQDIPEPLDDGAPDEYEFILACPPYHDLEEYTDQENDLSNMAYDEFLMHYRESIINAADLLKDGHFAVYVVGDVRDDEGAYRGLVADTIKCAQNAGLSLYNDAVMRTPLGSVQLRARNFFVPGRKLVKSHQNILVFYKGTEPDIHAIEETHGEPNEAVDMKADSVVREQVAKEEDEAATNGTTETTTSEETTNADEFTPPTDHTPDVSPIEEYQHNGGTVHVKRDDAYVWAGVRGIKGRALNQLINEADLDQHNGITMACARQSPNTIRIANLGEYLDVEAHVHTSHGGYTEVMEIAEQQGATIHQHKPGYMNVIKSKAQEDAEENHRLLIPFAVKHPVARDVAATQTTNVQQHIDEEEPNRIVAPVGSGTSLSGYLKGLHEAGYTNTPILGVKVGNDPTPTLNELYPGWRENHDATVELVESDLEYQETPPTNKQLLGTGSQRLRLDPNYEAKAIPHLKEGDLMLVVALRSTLPPHPYA
jgi:1-aminocyclopropane-1-carboxylate deaminase/D-cysteine desulfhydrase-like pyridoxal-dependent ACC family enzyme